MIVLIKLMFEIGRMILNIMKLVLLSFALLALVCSQCLGNYEYSDPNTNQCLPCGYSCLTCFNDLFCMQCVPQYYLYNDTCFKCSFGCSICSNATSCTTCNDGLYLTAAGTCSVCSTGVGTCTIATIQTCQDTYFLLDTICAGCLTNCKTCSDFVTCSQCSLGYYLVPSGSECAACPSNCRICTGSSLCSECEQGYTQNGGGCSLFNCASIDPFCIACANGQCLTCEQGKYVLNGVCEQGGSVLCLQSSGPYYTDCTTSSFGCTGYSQVQYDNGNQLSVCLPKSASKMSQYIYLPISSYACSGSCSTSNTVSLSYVTSQTYYRVSVYLSTRFYGNVSGRMVTISLTNENGTAIQSQTISVSIAKQMARYNQNDAGCLGCVYGQTIVASTFSYSGGQYKSNFTLKDSSGQIQVIEAMFEHLICQVEHCSSCSSSVDCSACFQPYYLQLTTCVSSCDAGFYLYSRTCYLQCPVGSYTLSSAYSCIKCISPCLTCSNQTSCVACESGYFLQGSQCLSNCSSLYLFPNSTSNVCQSCPNPCVTCSIANGSVSCLSCEVGYLYSGGSCIYLCPWGSFGNYVDGTSQCSLCDAACSSCYISSTTCSSCNAGYLLLGTVCTNISSCPSAYYADNVYNRCLACHYPCKTCQLLATNCSSCVRGMLLSNVCLNVCPATYFADYSDSSNVTCQPCVPNCVNCISAVLCISCSSGYYLHEGSCSATCPSEFFADSSNNSCTGCLPPCKTCATNSSCLSCATGYLDNAVCTLQCNSSSYIDSSFTCAKCIDPCLSCYSASSCLLCSLPYLLYNQSCLTELECLNKTGYYPNYSPNKTSAVSAECSACSFPCSSCSSNSVSCTTCVSGYLLVVSTSKCYSQCPTSYFVNGTLCEVCDSNCYKCSMIASNCTVCSGGMYLDPTVNSCVDLCPDGYYGDDQSGECVGCSSPCGNCYNPYLCGSCIVGILYSKQCVSSCPASTYLNSSINTCVACTSNCLTCAGSSSTCLSCSNGFFLYNSTCLLVCPTLYYGNQYTKTCDACISPCLACSSSSGCQSCIAGYYFLGGSCVASCSSSYYADSGTSQCLSCNMTICLTCVGDGNNCSTCNTGYYLYNLSCVATCPAQYYANSISGSCDGCPFPCLTCLNYTYCQSCLGSYYLFSSRCFSSCPVGYYSDNSSVCKSCSPNCQICASLTVCKQCVTNYFILNASCLNSCPLGYYQGAQAITNYDECMGCQTDCVNCSAYDYCIECAGGMIQFNGLCLSECPIFYYPDNSGVCDKCGPYCASCINSTYCVTCIGSYLLNNSCVAACPSKTYPYSGVSCKDCISPCQQCTGDYTCTTCVAGYIYFHNYCVSKCPSDVWYYPNNKSCNPSCPYNKYTATMTCYVGACGTRMVSLNGYCLAECSSNYYVNLNQECTLCEGGSGMCGSLFEADLKVLYMDVLTLVLYFNQKAQLASYSDITIAFVDIDGSNVPYNLQSHDITPYKIEFKFDYSAVNLVNITLTLPYVRSEESEQRISSNTYRAELPSYKNFSENESPSFIGFIPIICFVLLVVLLVINVINKASRFVQILDYIQLVAVTLYLNIQYPPILQSFLAGFRISIFSITKNLVGLTPFTFSPPKFIYYNTDTTLFRNELFLLLIFFVVFITFIVIIAVHTYNKQNCRGVVRVVRYRLLNDLFSVCMTPLFLFACQISHAKVSYLIISIAIVLLGIGYVAWISYKIIQVKKMSQLSGLLGDFQRTESKIGLMYIPFAFVRRIIFTIGLGLAPYEPISTITLLLVLTFLIMVCIYFYQPFDNQYTDYVTIFMESSLTLFVVCLIVLGLNVLSPSSSHSMGVFTVILVTLTMAICLGWLAYLTINDVRTKGWCPELKQEEDDGKEDYSDKKYQQDQEQIRQMEGLQRQGSKKGSKKVEKVEEKEQPKMKQDSANELINRFGSGSDDIFSNKSGGNQEFKHWSEQSSHGNHRQEGSLPHLLVKVQRNENDS